MTRYDPREYWNSVGEHVDERSGDNPSAGDSSPVIADQSYRVERDFFDTLPLEGRSVLEIGCGPGGKLSKLLSCSPGRLVGADLSPIMVELSQKRFEDQDVEVVQLERDVAYPFADQEFDVALTCTVLHHNTDDVVVSVLEQMARVTSEEIVLIEAVADETYSASPSFHLRDHRFYADVLAGHDFGLRSVDPLRNYASEQLGLLATRAAHTRYLGRPPYEEGAPVAPIRLAVERAGLPLTRLLDRVLHQKSGLSRLRFQRIG